MILSPDKLQLGAIYKERIGISALGKESLPIGLENDADTTSEYLLQIFTLLNGLKQRSKQQTAQRVQHSLENATEVMKTEFGRVHGQLNSDWQRSTLELQHQMNGIHAKFGGLSDWMTKIEKHLKEESKAQLQDHSQLFTSISSLNGDFSCIGAENMAKISKIFGGITKDKESPVYYTREEVMEHGMSISALIARGGVLGCFIDPSCLPPRGKKAMEAFTMASEENKDGSRFPVSAATLHPQQAMPSAPCNGVPNCEPSHLPDTVDLHLHGEMLWEELREQIAVGFEALASDMVKDMENVEHTSKDKVMDMNKNKHEVENKKKEKDKEKGDVKDKDKAKDTDKQKMKGKDNFFDKGQDTVKVKVKDKGDVKVMDKDKEKDDVEDCRKRKWSELVGDSQCTEKRPPAFERASEAVGKKPEGPKLCAHQTSPTTRTENTVLGPPSGYTNGVQNLHVKVSGKLQAEEVLPKIPPRAFGGKTGSGLGIGKESSVERVSEDQSVFSFDPLEASSPGLVVAAKQIDRASGGAIKYTREKNECLVEKSARRAAVPHPEQLELGLGLGLGLGPGLGIHIIKDCFPTHETGIPCEAKAAATTMPQNMSNRELNGLRSESKCTKSWSRARGVPQRSVGQCTDRQPQPRRLTQHWSLPEVENLIKGVQEFELGQWKQIAEKYFRNSACRKSKDLQLKWSRLVYQAETPVESRKCYVVQPTKETFAQILSTHRTATRACAYRCGKWAALKQHQGSQVAQEINRVSS